MIADELGAQMARVKIVQADGDKAYGDQNTDGSNSIRGIYEDMRRVGATARVMLVAAAAKRWNVRAADCVARDHAVTHLPTGRALGFGELALEARQAESAGSRRTSRFGRSLSSRTSASRCRSSTGPRM